MSCVRYSFSLQALNLRESGAKRETELEGRQRLPRLLPLQRQYLCLYRGPIIITQTQPNTRTTLSLLPPLVVNMVCPRLPLYPLSLHLPRRSLPQKLATGHSTRRIFERSQLIREGAYLLSSRFRFRVFDVYAFLCSDQVLWVLPI